jgi:hypothetical protein
MKNSEYTYTNQGRAAMTCEENLIFWGERYNEYLRQAELNRWLDGVTHPQAPSAPASPAILKRLAALGQAVLNL